MRCLRYWILPALFCLSVHASAQNKKEKNKDFDEKEWRVLDSTDENSFEEGNLEEDLNDTVIAPPPPPPSVLPDSLSVEDTAETTGEETDDDTTIEEKIRNGDIVYSRWDSVALGEWDESGQARLSLRKISAKETEELRKMDALNYEKDDKPADTTNNKGPMHAIGAWVRNNGVIFMWIFYIALGALLLTVLVLFIRKNDISFRWSSGVRNYGSFDVVADEGPQNFEALAAAAIAEGRLRDAVRFRYLHSLQLLETRQLITPGKDKTNMDFLRELSRTAFHKPFAALTLHYEYIWYGKLPLSTGQFSRLDDQFAAFSQSLKQHS